MLGRISAQSYNFDQTFRPYNSEKFALVRATEIIYVRTRSEISVAPPTVKGRTPEVISDNLFSLRVIDVIYSLS